MSCYLCRKQWRNGKWLTYFYFTVMQRQIQESIWIGLNDRNNESHFEWLDESPVSISCQWYTTKFVCIKSSGLLLQPPCSWVWGWVCGWDVCGGMWGCVWVGCGVSCVCVGVWSVLVWVCGCGVWVWVCVCVCVGFSLVLFCFVFLFCFVLCFDAKLFLHV